MRNEIREQIVNKLSDKEYRDIFVSEQINTGLAFQIRTMREKRGWTQSQLGEKAGMAQSRISVMEDANYSRFSLNTLKRLASAFDVALVVRFEPFSRLVEHFVTLDSSSLNIPSFQEDEFYLETSPSENLATLSANGYVVRGFPGTYETRQCIYESPAGWQPVERWMSFVPAQPFQNATAIWFHPLVASNVERIDVAPTGHPAFGRASV